MGDVTNELVPADLTDAQILTYFEEYCRCTPPDIERSSHSYDCDEDPCEDAHVAMGGRPLGCGYRSTVEAIIHTNAARRRVADHLNARAKAGK